LGGGGEKIVKGAKRKEVGATPQGKSEKKVHFNGCERIVRKSLWASVIGGGHGGQYRKKRGSKKEEGVSNCHSQRKRGGRLDLRDKLKVAPKKCAGGGKRGRADAGRRSALKKKSDINYTGKGSEEKKARDLHRKSKTLLLRGKAASKKGRAGEEKSASKATIGGEGEH